MPLCHSAQVSDLHEVSPYMLSTAEIPLPSSILRSHLLSVFISVVFIQVVVNGGSSIVYLSYK